MTRNELKYIELQKLLVISGFDFEMKESKDGNEVIHYLARIKRKNGQLLSYAFGKDQTEALLKAIDRGTKPGAIGVVPEIVEVKEPITVEMPKKPAQDPPKTIQEAKRTYIFDKEQKKMVQVVRATPPTNPPSEESRRQGIETWTTGGHHNDHRPRGFPGRSWIDRMSGMDGDPDMDQENWLGNLFRHF